MTIPDNLKANGFGLVASYYTNPWYKYSIPGNIEADWATTSKKLMYAWTGGLTVPIFNPYYGGYGGDDKKDYGNQLYDPICDASTKFWTDEDVHNWPDKLSQGSGNVFHSCLKGDLSQSNFGIRPDNITKGDKDSLYPPSKLSDPLTKLGGPFYIRSPGAGLDHVTSYYWGGGPNQKTSKIKNIIGLHWMENHSGDGKFYAWVNKICFLYQDAEGKEVPLIPLGNRNLNGLKEANKYMKFPDEDNGICPPGCGGSNQQTNIKGNSAFKSGVLRGAFLDPKQVRFVVDNGLELKGMWIEIYRNTSSSAKKADPELWMHSLFPWILDETTRFGEYYLHPFDFMISRFGAHHNEDAVENFIGDWYTDEDMKKRDEFFEAYNSKINYGNGIYVDQTGVFNKKIIIPDVTNMNDDGLYWTDERAPLQSRKYINGYIST
jgi:hypothetical protein